MTAENRLKEYFYNHIINHEDFNIKDCEDENDNVIELPKTFDDLIRIIEDYYGGDWYNEFNVDDLEYEIAENEKDSLVYIYEVAPNVFISLRCYEQKYPYNWIYQFEYCKYVKQVEVTRKEWQPIS